MKRIAAVSKALPPETLAKVIGALSKEGYGGLEIVAEAGGEELLVYKGEQMYGGMMQVKPPMFGTLGAIPDWIAQWFCCSDQVTPLAHRLAVYLAGGGEVDGWPKEPDLDSVLALLRRCPLDVLADYEPRLIMLAARAGWTQYEQELLTALRSEPPVFLETDVDQCDGCGRDVPRQQLEDYNGQTLCGKCRAGREKQAAMQMGDGVGEVRHCVACGQVHGLMVRDDDAPDVLMCTACAEYEDADFESGDEQMTCSECGRPLRPAAAMTRGDDKLCYTCMIDVKTENGEAVPELVPTF